MQNFMKEVEEKIELRKKYKMEMMEYSTDSKEYNKLNKAQKEIKDWLNQQVDLDLPVYFTRATYYSYLKRQEEEKNKIKVSKEDNIPFGKFYEMSFNAEELAHTQPREKYLNVDKIKDLDDVKRVLKFLKIKAIDDGIMQTNGFEEVRDLFE